MKAMNCMAILLSGSLLLSGCGTLNNTAKGGMLGAGSGAALGALIGGIAGHGKGAAIGAAVGAAVGTGAGVLIGKKMDKAAAQAAEIEGAQVEQVTDNNGLQAVKVTFDSGILFNTSSSTLSTSAKASLSKFANSVLNQNRDMDVAIYGYTDNTGWKNSTREQSVQKNLELSQARAQSVSTYLMQCGAASTQIKAVEGMGESNPVADNNTAAGRQENRRVEVYMYASQQMIQQAEAGTLK
jgi:outer membrane protein OmpA-like peptidoglycan-associated protein